MNSIRPGTLCYLVRCSAENLGRVVEVVSPSFEAEDGSGAWHNVDADWLRGAYPGREYHAQPCNLRPIAGPRPEASGVRDATPKNPRIVEVRH
jgi:hypothetical protein